MSRAACPLDCPDACSLDVDVAPDGRTVLSLDAALGNPFTQGFICRKVRRFANRVHSPERVLTPLVRNGPKGSASFRPASWDEALDVIEVALRAAVDRHGPGSVVPYLYSSSAGLLAAGALGPRLWRRFGASAVAETICAATAGEAWRRTYGSMLSADPFDVARARMIVVWGANPAVSNTHLPPLIAEATRAGASLVVVDPRRTATAKRAGLHLAPRPGTDVALALAMAAHLEREGLLAASFIAEHADGAGAFLDAARLWTLARAAATCDVPAADIAGFAEAYATTRPALLRIGWGLERNRNGGSACLAVLALPVLAGQFGVAGSGVIASLSSAAPVSMRRGDPDIGLDDAPRRPVNMNQLGALLCGELDGPPASVLFVQGANPAVTCPDQVRVLRGLERDDLFTVVHDQVLTDTAALADVVLPAPTHLELDDLVSSYGSFTLQRSRPVIERVGEARSNDEVSAAVAARFGWSADFDPDPERLIAAAVLDGDGEAPVRVLRQPGATVQFVDTFPSGAGRRARLHHPGTELPLPRFAPLANELSAAYPLTLVSPATSRTINSMLTESDPPAAVVSVHPDDARVRGLSDGQQVEVAGPSATIVLPCRIDADLRPGVCMIPKGLWRRHVASGMTANAFAPGTISDLAGGACFNDAAVDVRAIIGSH